MIEIWYGDKCCDQTCPVLNLHLACFVLFCLCNEYMAVCAAWLHLIWFGFRNEIYYYWIELNWLACSRISMSLIWSLRMVIPSALILNFTTTQISGLMLNGKSEIDVEELRPYVIFQVHSFFHLKLWVEFRIDCVYVLWMLVSSFLYPENTNYIGIHIKIAAYYLLLPWELRG